jgi:hypothetical protein
MAPPLHYVHQLKWSSPVNTPGQMTLTFHDHELRDSLVNQKTLLNLAVRA